MILEGQLLPIDELPGVESTVNVTVGREASLGSGYVDVLWVDVEGRLTVIEVKLRSNPEVRREVLAQALSYGAFLEGMTVESFFDGVARPYLSKVHGDRLGGFDLPAAVAALAGAEIDHANFWEGLERSLNSGGFRILIVVDEAHSQLRRSVAYVNRHADFEIYLVEVGFHRSEDGAHEILVPRFLDVDATQPTARSRSGRTTRDWDLDAYFEQIKAKYPYAEEPIRRLLVRLDDLEEQGLIELDFGGGQHGSRIVRLPEVGKAVLWVRASGSVQFPRYPLRDLGYSDGEVTAYMAQIAEVSGVPASKYESAQEPQVVLPEKIADSGVVERIGDVVEALVKDFAGRRRDLPNSHTRIDR